MLDQPQRTKRRDGLADGAGLKERGGVDASRFALVGHSVRTNGNDLPALHDGQRQAIDVSQRHLCGDEFIEVVGRRCAARECDEGSTTDYSTKELAHRMLELKLRRHSG